MDYKARAYDPFLQKFIQPDTVVANPYSSQGYNRYAYVNNNPVNLTDPSGHCFTGAVADTIFCVFVGALVIGALAGGASSAIRQSNETGHIDFDQVIGDALGGAVIAGAPFVAIAAAPEILTGTGYVTWSTGQAIGNSELSNVGVNQFAAGLQLSEVYSNPFPIVAPRQPAPVQTSPDFIVSPNGDTVIVPDGAEGPFPTRSGKGFLFMNGEGGKGLDSRVIGVRIMDQTGPNPPSPGYPNGYASYFNGNGQTVNPYTGRTIEKFDPWWHIAFGKWQD